MIHDLEPDDLGETDKKFDVISNSSESLAVCVITYRALGIDKGLAIVCMEELARRRQMGEEFDYESFIEENVSEMPQMKGINLTEMGKRVMKFNKVAKDG